MGTRLAPSRSTRLVYAMLAVAMVASLIVFYTTPPAQALPGDTGPGLIPGSSLAALQDADGQWDTKNQHRIWLNEGRWDAILPMGSGSNWRIMKSAVPDAPGQQPVNGPVVSNDDELRPDIYWDDANNLLYVLMSGGGPSQLWVYNYTDGTDTYALQSGPTDLPDMGAPQSRAAIFKTSNGDLWASVMHSDGLLVTRSTNGGTSWANPVNHIVPIEEGQTQLTEFSDGGDFVAVAAAEDGDAELEGGRYSQYLFYKLDLANVANWDQVTHAEGTLTMATQPQHLDKVTIHNTTYTFKQPPAATGLTAPEDVLLGANVAATRANLIDAVNGDEDAAGVTYHAGTGTHPAVYLEAAGGANITAIAKQAGGAANSFVTQQSQGMTDVGNVWSAPTLTGGASTWVREPIPIPEAANAGATVHADDELSLVTHNNVVYIATETQRSGVSAEIEQDPQVILYDRQAGGVWTPNVVKNDQQTSTDDYKRPVVGIVDNNIYVIAIDNPQTESVYWVKAIVNLGTSWGNPNPVFRTAGENYRNNIVPREPVSSPERLPVISDYTGLWQTSLPAPNNNNQAPGVTLGNDRTVQISPAMNLGAITQITNDASGGAINWAWTKVSGPGTTQFSPASGTTGNNCSANPCSPAVTVKFGRTGVYVLRLTVTESGANPLTNFDEIRVTVGAVNNAPTINVQEPDGGEKYAKGAPVLFQATANDPEDGNLTASITWTSSRDGAIGGGLGGGPFSLTNLSSGTHSIRAHVSDGQNNVSSSARTIVVGTPTPPPPPPPGEGGFLDTDGHTHEAAIGWLAEQGITEGCNPPDNDLFCPDDNVSRGQMAAFLVRAFDYNDDGGGGFFDDTVGNIFETAIDRLRVAGITEGCNPPDNDEYCPNGFVTRGQMAAFLVRAFGYSDEGSADFFTDTEGVFETAINRLRVAEVTQGCNPPDNDEFCPDDLVTRGQMATFLKRGFDNQ